MVKTIWGFRQRRSGRSEAAILWPTNKGREIFAIIEILYILSAPDIYVCCIKRQRNSSAGPQMPVGSDERGRFFFFFFLVMLSYKTRPPYWTENHGHILFCREAHIRECPLPSGVQWRWNRQHCLRCSQLASPHDHLETRKRQNSDGQRWWGVVPACFSLPFRLFVFLFLYQLHIPSRLLLSSSSPRSQQTAMHLDHWHFSNKQD